VKYISIDIETTGLDPEYCQILEVAAVADDLAKPRPMSELPSFQTYVKRQRYRGEPYALAMHAGIFQKLIGDPDAISWCNDENLMEDFSEWLREVYGLKQAATLPKIVVAGKNFSGFDKVFLDRHFNEFNGDTLQWHHRVLDPMMLYLKPDDIVPPSSEECLKRALLDPEVKHEALDDAMMVIKLLRAHFRVAIDLE
jgi:oligoribonuclease